MINPFNVETFVWYWYLYWMPVSVAVLAITYTAIIWGTTKLNLYGSFIRVLSIITVAASLPLAAMRLDFTVSGNIYVMLGMSLGSSIGVITLMMMHSMVLGNGLKYVTGFSTSAFGIKGQPAGNGNVFASEGKGLTKDNFPKAEISNQEGKHPTPDKKNPKVSPSVEPPSGWAGISPRQSPNSVMGTITGDPQSSAWIVAKNGKNGGVSHKISSSVMSIGRSQKNNFIVEDPTVSRFHAVIKKSQSGYELVDIGSTGGTSINGNWLYPKKLEVGSKLQVGDTELSAVSVDSLPARRVPLATHGKTIDGTLNDTKKGLVLVVTKGPDNGKSFLLQQGFHTIGRSSSCDVVLIDPKVSRKHATVKINPEYVAVSDAGSTSGTIIDGTKISGLRLENNDHIKIGGTILEFFDSSDV